MYNRLLIERHLPIPVRDGAVLRADVYRPDTELRVPAIVVRLPYNKDAPRMRNEGLDAVRAAEAGFATVYQDTRGRYLSEGGFYPFVNEGPDGFDTVEWIAAQPWCNGSVGMTGASYFGATQWLAAVEQPPHLKAIFPVVTASDYYEGWTYQGGAFQLGFALFWTLISLSPDTAMRQAAAGKTDPDEWARLFSGSDDMSELYRHLPLTSLPLLAQSQSAPYYFDWIAHSHYDEYWQSIAINRRYPRVQVPAFSVGGWYDLFLHGTLENFIRMQKEGGSEEARTGQRLLIGPWAHGNYSGNYPEHIFGAFSASDMVDLTALQLRYFGRYLRGDDNGFDEEAPVRLFVMGEKRWRSENEWPLARTRYTSWFLHSNGDAGGAGGLLSLEGPGEGPPDSFVYDPANPTPTVGGPTFFPGLNVSANTGPRDQRAVEARPDVLVYTSQPLAAPLEVTGPLVATLYAATTAPDTDFVVRLCDVAPDGVSIILVEGILRARFREGTDRERPIEPGRVYAYNINLVATSNLFQVGHRVRVDVCSSSFPRFDRNPNTGHPLGADGPGQMQPARQTVLHDHQRPSHILLPVIPR